MISKHILIKGLTLCVVIVGTANAAPHLQWTYDSSADTWTPPSSWSYGDIIDPPSTVPTNQQGWANDPRWQMLGQSWGTADGVSWSTDGGATFGNETIHVGQSVIFQFDMHKTLYGTHTFDALRAWIDFGHDGYSLNGDRIIQDKWHFNHHGHYSDDPYASHNGHSRYYANKDKLFYSDPITFAEAGDFNLLARVTCSRDLGGGSWPNVPDNWDKLTPWLNDGGNHDLYQGEVEQYRLHVVPVPSALLLAGLGLVAVRRFRKRLSA